MITIYIFINFFWKEPHGLEEFDNREEKIATRKNSYVPCDQRSVWSIIASDRYVGLGVFGKCWVWQAMLVSLFYLSFLRMVVEFSFALLFSQRQVGP